MIKINGDSFAADYYPDIQLDSVCVNHISSTKVRVRRYNVMYYIFLTIMEEVFIYVSPLRL